MVEIGQRIFKTKKDAEDFIRSILYKYSPNDPLVGDDLVFVSDLLNLHPESEKKIGVGVRSIIIERETTFNKTNHFCVIRVDGSKEDFSFKKCLSPSLNNSIKIFYSSARRSIADQILSFRDDYFFKNEDLEGRVKCSITGILINKNSSHIDHVPPDTFNKIVSDFINMNGINVEKIEFVGSPNGIGRVLADNNLINLFSDFHRKSAKLRVVSVLANLKQKKD